MDLSKYLYGIEIPTDNEEHLKRFIMLNEEAIRTSLIKIWDEYNSKNSEETFLHETNNHTVEDGKKSTQKTDDSDIKSEATEHSEDPLTDIHDDLTSINSVISDEEKPKETNDYPIDSINEPINFSVEDKAGLGQESIQKQADPSNGKKLNEAFELQIKNKSVILPNGKANQTYKFLFRIEELGITDIASYEFEGLEKIGLNFSSETYEIKGIPLIAGEHKIKLKIKRNDWYEGKPVFEREIMLIINPDPKTLWKNIPTPSDIEYFKHDFDKFLVRAEGGTGLLGFGKANEKIMVAASQRGRSHAQEGKPRDDDFGLKFIKENGWYILAVADGAGGSEFSRKGSEIACKTFIESCENLIKNHQKEFEHQIKEFNANKTEQKRKLVGDTLYKIVGSSIFKSCKNIEEEALLSDRPIKKFSTTLIVAICKKFKFGWFIGAFWVGDGGIGIYNRDIQVVKVLGEPDSGEFAGQTRFLTMPEITESRELYRRLRFEIVDNFTSLILMTDGITDPKFETDSNLVKLEKWNELWKDLENEVVFSYENKVIADQLLKWLDFWSPGNHDDRTIAILF
jgi:serine/threonine protein phosphatase PrpC